MTSLSERDDTSCNEAREFGESKKEITPKYMQDCRIPYQVIKKIIKYVEKPIMVIRVMDSLIAEQQNLNWREHHGFKS